jgi:hypothetical protein
VKFLIGDQEFERTRNFVIRDHETLKPETIIGEMSPAREEEAVIGK